jgi:serine/threonine-protein kinase
MDDTADQAGLGLAPGVLIGRRYRLHGVLGRGATGTVWEAEHALLTSRVAIKFLDATRSLEANQAELLLERFRFEAQISARLASVTDRIVAVQDAGLYKGVPYIVMEFAPGETLAARIDRSPLSPSDVADLLDQLASALDAAHRAGFAHRDVKPPNVLCVRAEGAERPSYKLADFGVAKSFRDSAMGLVPPKQTSENVLVGSPAYMCPEYVSGTATQDGSGDVWALGVLAYEALTANIPFEGEAWTQVAVAIVQGHFHPPSHHVPALGRPIDAIFERAFSLERAQRFASAGEFARAFRAAAVPDAVTGSGDVRRSDVPIHTDSSVTTASDVGQEGPPTNRSKLWLWGGAIAAIAIAGIVGVATMVSSPQEASSAATQPAAAPTAPEPKAPPPPPVESARATSEPTAAPSAEPSASSRRPARTPGRTPPPPASVPKKHVDPSATL